MIKYYFGDMGSGKTLSMILEAELIRQKILSLNKRKFLCFTDIDYRYKTNDLWDIVQPKYQNKNDYKLLLFDEVDKFTDSRKSSSRINRFLSYIIGLSRKTDMDIILSAQIFSSVDTRLRTFSQYITSCKFVPEEDKLIWNMFSVRTNNEFSKRLIIDKEYLYSLYSTDYLTIDIIDLTLKKFDQYVKNFGKSE